MFERTDDPEKINRFGCSGDTRQKNRRSVSALVAYQKKNAETLTGMGCQTRNDPESGTSYSQLTTKD